MLKVYGDYRSGNCYKVKLMLHLLGQDYQWVAVNILRGENRAPEFLAKNPNGKVPVLEWADGLCLWESNAILHSLAEGSEYLPSDPRLRTQVLQWQFFEQYSHEPYIGLARYQKIYEGIDAQSLPLYKQRLAEGYHALSVMEQQLQRTDFLVGEHCSVADVALYAYTHVAPEGGFDLSRFPALQCWLERIQALPNYVGMFE